MKNLKRIFGMLLVMAMLLVQIIPTTNVSAEEEKETGTITISNALEGETYSIYKMLSLVSYNKEAKTYVYKVEGDWKSFITTGEGAKYLTIVDDAQDTADNTYVIWKEGVSKDDVTSLAEDAIEYAKTNNIAVTASKTTAPEEDDDTTTTVEFTGLDLGYYLVDSTLGAICGLTTTNPKASVNEKNTVPTVVKEVQEGETWGETNDAKIGDTVNFRTTITVGKGTENYVLYDIMSAGLTLDANSIKVYVGGTEVSSANYTISTPGKDGETFTISFTNDYIKTLNPGTSIVVEYSATLNKNAVIEGEGNPNETYIKYGNAGESTHDKTITYTYAFDLVKVNSKNESLTATFKLYGSETGTDEIPVVLIDAEKNIYRVAVAGEEGVIITAGSVTIVGLDDDTYYLEEITAPEGYNKLTGRVEVIISRVNEETETYERLTETVVNYTGAELPSTGGIGTMLFITIGSLMVVCFGVLLVTKLRMSKANI